MVVHTVVVVEGGCTPDDSPLVYRSQLGLFWQPCLIDLPQEYPPVNNQLASVVRGSGVAWFVTHQARWTLTRRGGECWWCGWSHGERCGE